MKKLIILSIMFIVSACETPNKKETSNPEKDSRFNFATTKSKVTVNKVKTQLMFQGSAEKAVEFYASIFSDFKVNSRERYGKGEQVKAGSLKLAHISFAGHDITIYDSPPVHKFSFTPSFSFFLDFESESELNAAFVKLADKGKIMMPLNNYGFSKMFGWVEDQFGVSWQLNLPSTQSNKIE